MAMRVGKAIIKKKGSKGERTEKRDEMRWMILIRGMIS
jgi:hypothetical protein